MAGSDYTTDRDLAAYAIVLGADFLDFVASLTREQHWIDAGAGEARALRAFVAGHQAAHPRLTAIGLVAPGESLPLGLRHVVGAVESEDLPAIAPADLITDVYGPLQYSLEPGRVIERYALWLKPGGRLWFASPAATHVQTSAGEIDLAAWACRLAAFDVLRGPRADAPGREVVLVRNARPPAIPRLQLTLNVDGPPPLRRFRE